MIELPDSAVIAILVALAALLFVVVGKATQAAKSANTLNRLREIGEQKGLPSYLIADADALDATDGRADAVDSVGDCR